ncbi:MAG TPA: hypothetical protein VHC98_00065 [Candidatus Saccharimonadales bacterium]|nr:hypothetical protein [Candidatus Saccharimonadales bacterium]
MATKTSRTSAVLALSANWQAAFITLVILGWAGGVALMIFNFVTIDQYVSGGTWAFWITSWLLPVLFFGTALACLRHYRQAVQRVFMACLASTIGMLAYGLASGWENRLWYSLHTQAVSAGDTSWWAAFGNDWTVMAVCLALYASGLMLVTHRGRR